MHDLQVQFVSGNLWLAVLFCLLFWLVTWLYYRRTTPPLGRGLRILLAALRIIAIGAIFLSLAQPILNFSTRTEIKKKAVVLTDRSGSTNNPLNPDNSISRIQKIDEILDGAVFKQLNDNMDVDYYSFAESLSITEDGRDLMGNKSNPGVALEQLKRLSGINPPDYVFILSDGRVTAGRPLVEAVGDLGSPVYTVAVGDSVRDDDVALDNIIYDDVVYAGYKTDIKAIVSQRGDFDSRLSLTLKDGNKILAQETEGLPGDEKTGEYTINYTPNVPGRLILDLNINSGDRDGNKLNNQRKFYVRVLKSRIRVLLYSSSLNQEYGFLNRYLKSRDDIEVVSVIDATGGDRLGERFPASQEALNSFDALILIDPDLNRLSDDYDRLNSYLTDRGGGIMVLMGPISARSVKGNRLAGFLPLALSGGGASALNYGEFHIVPDQQMIFHPTLMLADNRDEIVAKWVNQPPFTLSLNVDSLQSGAVTLGYLDDPGRDRRMPVLAFRRQGAGKIMASAVAPFWHWAFYPIGIGGDDKDYRQFMASTLRWLTLGEESDRVNFGPLADVFQSGEEVIFTGLARDEGYRPITSAGGEVILVSENGDTVSAAITAASGKTGRYRADPGVLPPGSYNYRAELRAEGIDLGRFEGRLAVDETDRETALSDVDWTALELAATASGGEFVSYLNPEDLIGNIDFSTVKRWRQHEIRLWDNTVVLIIILVALSLEWFIRKRRQLL